MLLPQFSGVTSFYLDYFDFFDDSDFNKSRINFLSGLVNVRNIFENFAASVSTFGLAGFVVTPSLCGPKVA